MKANTIESAQIQFAKGMNFDPAIPVAIEFAKGGLYKGPLGEVPVELSKLTGPDGCPLSGAWRNKANYGLVRYSVWPCIVPKTPAAHKKLGLVDGLVLRFATLSALLATKPAQVNCDIKWGVSVQPCAKQGQPPAALRKPVPPQVAVHPKAPGIDTASIAKLVELGVMTKAEARIKLGLDAPKAKKPAKKAGKPAATPPSTPATNEVEL